MSLLDITDRKILRFLQNDAKLTNKELADKLGKSVTPVYERIRRLEREGFIKQYVALLDRQKVGIMLLAYTNVQLKEHSYAMLKAFEKAVVRLDEVMECNHMTGSYDYLLKIGVRGMEEYQDFIINKLSRLANISTVQSSFVMTELKNETAFHLT
jgi:Lrp/AsnC family transcriptional regulator, leucine-responsive regulatory protein